MKKIILLLTLMTVFFGGCVEQEGNEKATNIDAILATDMQQINDALEKGPVLVTIGAESCPSCQLQKPVLVEMAGEYQSRASVIYVDSGINPEPAIMFGVRSIPDTTVIVEIEDGKYIFMGRDGPTDDRFNARFLGFREKEMLSERLDLAIETREK